MTSDLNQHSMFAQQHFDELVSLVPIDRVLAGELGEGPKRRRVEVLLKNLFRCIGQIQSALVPSVPVDNQAPMLDLPPHLAKFLRYSLLPNARGLREIYLKSTGQDILLRFLQQTSTPESAATIRNALRFCANYANILLEDDDDRRWMVEVAFDFIEKEWFQPDAWGKRLALLRPVVVGRDTSSVPTHVRIRLAEAYRTFTFGAWMATMALCRAIVEYALTNRAPHLGIASTKKDAKGNERYRTLDDLIEQTSKKRPELTDHLRVLQDAGNRVLHPKKKQNVIASPRILQAEALDCLKHTIEVVEGLYAE